MNGAAPPLQHSTEEFTRGAVRRQAPTLGRIVLYRLTAEDVAAIGRQRLAGGQDHVGNSVVAGEAVVGIIVAVWPAEFGPDEPGVNLQVLLDGRDSYWVTSAREGYEPGQWSWPPRV